MKRQISLLLVVLASTVVANATSPVMRSGSMNAMSGCLDCFNFVAPTIAGAESVNPAEVGLIVYDSQYGRFRGYTSGGVWSKLSNERITQTISTSTTLTSPSDFVFLNSAANGFTLNLPDATSFLGREIYLKKVSSDVNPVSIHGYSTQTIDGSVAVNMQAPNDVLKVVSDGANWQSVSSTPGLVPPGTVLPYAGTIAPPGFLLCNGTSYSATAYPALFAVIGYTYGGSGSTFNIPDTRGIFVRGAGTNGTLTMANGTAFSTTLGAKQNDQFQGHAHSIPSNAIAGTALGFNMNFGGSQPYNLNSNGLASDGTNGAQRSGPETRPANVALNYIIKY